MYLWSRLKVWWRGVPTSITELEGGGWRLEYQHPDHPPARTRLVAATRHRVFKWVRRWLGVIIGGTVVAVIGAAAVNWLGL